MLPIISFRGTMNSLIKIYYLVINHVITDIENRIILGILLLISKSFIMNKL